MKIITLTTDFGLKDHYAGKLRGALYSAAPGVVISDISHLVPPFDVPQGAHILGHSWSAYPEGTVHIVSVGASPGGRFNHIAFQYKQHFFIGMNNGIFSLMDIREPDQVVEICPAGKEPGTFPALDIYVPVAAAISGGRSFAVFSTEPARLTELMRPRHLPEENVIKGNVVYIDSFGNLVTDITREHFEKTGGGRPFTIQLIGDDIDRLSKHYRDAEEGEKLALFNSEGLLEIAINQGKASQLLNMRLNSVIRIQFE